MTIDPTFTQQQKLMPSDEVSGDMFGASVAISVDTVVVGAPDDYGALGSDEGSAYVFGSALPNTPPTITAASLSRTQGVPASTSTIAEVDDAEDARNTLTVTVNGAASATMKSVTLSSISVNVSSQVKVSIGADSNASNASFTLARNPGRDWTI